MVPPNGRRRARSGGAGRRVFFLTLGGLVTVSLAFTFGVLVGRQSVRSHPARAGGEAAKKPQAVSRRGLSDTEAVKPPEIQEKLTFYQTLTAPLAAAPPRDKAEPAKPGSPPRSEPDALADEPKRFTVQVAAYRGRPAAEEMEEKLKGAGFDAYVAAGGGDAVRAPYRVRVGSFASRAEAEQMAERLRKERGLPTLVTTR